MRLALVTGGHRRVGAAIAARLADDDWTLALHGHSEAKPEPFLLDRLKSWHGFVADLARIEEAERLLKEVRDHFGALPTLLVNSASRFHWDDAHSIKADDLALHQAVNATAPVWLAILLGRSEGAGSIVNILDQRLRNPNGDQLSYTLSKAALAGATRTLAAALAPKWRVNAVAPGLTLPTPDYTPEQLERVRMAMPLDRLPTPDDVADAVAYLASARAVTAQTIFVDGGASLKSFDRDFAFI